MWWVTIRVAVCNLSPYSDAKRYCFHNQESGEYTWEYPTPQSLLHQYIGVTIVIYCCVVASRTGAKSLQQLQDVTNEGHSTPSEAVEVTEPIQGPLPLGDDVLY